jgi:hypothetical protein
MNDTLKAAGRIGAELGAAKAEVERLRGLLYLVAKRVRNGSAVDRIILERIDAALSQQAESECVACEGHPAACNNPCALCGKQAEPTDTFTAVDMATAAAQGLRDWQAAVEPAPAQDERELPDYLNDALDNLVYDNYERSQAGSRNRQADADLIRAALATRPAQTEQQPDCDWCAGAGHDPYGHPCQHCKRSDLFTTFAMHQRVRKTSGSEWQGRICGTYSTELTPEGYAVESEAHAGSVQIYPAKALEAVE